MSDVDDLVEFLRERIAEDEAVARRCHTGPPIVQALQVGMDHHEGVQSGWVEIDAGRVLAECEAKRQRVDLIADLASKCPEDDWPSSGDIMAAPLADLARHLLKIEAQPHADHPDFRDEWRTP